MPHARQEINFTSICTSARRIILNVFVLCVIINVKGKPQAGMAEGFRRVNKKQQSELPETEKSHDRPAQSESELSLLHTQKQVRVSVIVPTYNNADILPKCLDALMAQDFPHDQYEIIVVDDGSRDATSQIVSQYTQKTPLVQYLYQPNQGPASARNQGVRRANGDIIMFTDDDCEPERNWVTEMYRPFRESNGEIAAVKGAYRTRQKNVIARFAQTEFENRYRRMRNIQYIDFVDTYAAAFRRETFLSLNGFDTRFPVANNEDVEFSYRMASKGHKMVFNPNAIVYHKHPDTIYKYLKVKFGRAYWRMAVYKSFPDKMKSDSYTPQTLKLQVVLSFILLTTVISAFICYLFADLIDPSLYKRYAVLSLSIIALFLLSTLPFIVSVLDSPLLNKFLAFLQQFLKRGFIKQVLHNIREFFSNSFLSSLYVATCKTLRKSLAAFTIILRNAIKSNFIAFCLRMLRKSAAFVAALISAVFKMLWRIICLPIGLIVMISRGVARLCRFISNLSFMRKIFAMLNKIATTRIVMIPLSILMLFLRGIVMAFGIIWGLQSHESRKGRFSQVAMLVVSDILAVICASAAAYYSRYYLLHAFFNNHDYSTGFYFQYLPFMVIFFLTVFLLSGLYKPYKGLSQVNEFVLITKSVFTVTVVSIILLYLTGNPHSKTVVLLLFFYTLVFVPSLRWLSRKFFKRVSSGKSEREKTRVLIVGTQEIGRLICRKLQSTASVETTIVGFIDRDPLNVGISIDGYDVIGSFDDLGKIIDSHGIHEVFVALPMMPQEEILSLVNKISGKEGVHFHIISNLFDLVSAEIDIAEHNNIPITYLKNENVELVHIIVKRLFDIFVSAVVLLVTFPFWILIMIAIKLETDGPSIFRQERVGKNGKIFQIHKFRTMYSETAKFEYSPSSPDDKRITKVGKFLRKTSLDEFPQFLNVLKGEMSLVGPRPEMPFIVEQYKHWQRERLKVKPGLTGLWQIMGRKDLPLHDSLEYDFYYIKNQSLLLDLTILIKTIPIILLGKGAY